MKKLYIKILTAVLAVFGMSALLAGCGGSITTNSGSEESITALATLEALKNGMNVILLENNNGLTVTKHPVRVSSVYKEGDNNLAVLKVADSSVIGPGFSGSPVVVNRTIWGPLFAGYYGDNKTFYARWIGDMVGIGRGRGGDNGMPLSFQVAGVSASQLEFLKRTNPEYFGKFVRNDKIDRVSAVSRGGVPDPIPGRSISVNLLTGDLYSGYAVGTFTVKQDGRWLIFGHSLDWLGERRMPVGMAWVDAIVTEFGSASFKLAHPYGASMGILTQDRERGCSVEWGVEPELTPLVTTVTLPGQVPKVFRHQLAKAGQRYEFDWAAFALAAPLEHVRDLMGGGAGSLHFVFRYAFEGGEETVVEEDLWSETLAYDLYWRIGMEMTNLAQPGQSLAHAEIEITLGGE